VGWIFKVCFQQECRSYTRKVKKRGKMVDDGRHLEIQRRKERYEEKSG
jgi:hypothetical protein